MAKRPHPPSVQAPDETSPAGLDHSQLRVRDSAEATPFDRELRRLATLGALTLGIGHDLINTVIAMEMSAGQARKASSMSGARSALERVEETSRRCRRIVESMIGLVAHGVLDKTEASLVAVVRKAVDAVRDSEEDELTVRVPRDVMLECNPAALEVIFTNLVRNSVQATGAGCEIDIDVEEDRDEHRLVYRDHGPGFAPEHLAHVFDMFYSTNTSGARHGLGLALSRELVHAHGGSVSATNHESGGAVVTIRLPRAGRSGGRRYQRGD